MFGVTKFRKLCNIITHNVIWANWETESMYIAGNADMQCLTQHIFPAFNRLKIVCLTCVFLTSFQVFCDTSGSMVNAGTRLACWETNRMCSTISRRLQNTSWRTSTQHTTGEAVVIVATLTLLPLSPHRWGCYHCWYITSVAPFPNGWGCYYCWYITSVAPFPNRWGCYHCWYITSVALFSYKWSCD